MIRLRCHGMLLAVLLAMSILIGNHARASEVHTTPPRQSLHSGGDELSPKDYEVRLAELESRLETDPENERLRVEAVTTAARAGLQAEVRHHTTELVRRNPYSMRIRWTLPTLLGPPVDTDLLSDIREILLTLVEQRDHPFHSEIKANLGVIEFYLAVGTLTDLGGETPLVNEVLLRSAIERMEQVTKRRRSPALLSQLAYAYLVDDQPRRAIARYRRAVDLSGELGSLMALGAAEQLHAFDEPQAAGAFARRALDIESRQLHQSSGLVHDANQWLGLYYLLVKDDLREAETHLRRSTEVPDRVFPNMELRTRRISTPLTSALLVRGRIGAVQEYLDVMEKRWPQLEDTWKEFRSKMQH